MTRPVPRVRRDVRLPRRAGPRAVEADDGYDEVRGEPTQHVGRSAELQPLCRLCAAPTGTSSYFNSESCPGEASATRSAVLQLDGGRPRDVHRTLGRDQLVDRSEPQSERFDHQRARTRVVPEHAQLHCRRRVGRRLRVGSRWAWNGDARVVHEQSEPDRRSASVHLGAVSRPSTTVATRWATTTSGEVGSRGHAKKSGRRRQSATRGRSRHFKAASPVTRRPTASSRDPAAPTPPLHRALAEAAA